MKDKRSSVGISLSVLLLAVLLPWMISCGGGNGEEAEEVEREDITAVEVYSVQRMDMARHLDFSGILEAGGDVTVSAETGGSIARVPVKEGEPVHSGDLVIRLDDTSARFSHQAALAQLEGAESTLAIAEDPMRAGQIAQLESALSAAEAQFDVAEAGLERAQNLYDEGAISEADLEVAEAGYEGAKAGRDSAREILDLALEGSREEELEAARSAVDAARANLGLMRDMLDKTSIRAPIDGVISDIWFEQGELVGPGTPVFRIVNSDALTMEVGFSDREVTNISVGQEVDVAVDAYPDRIISGVITRIGVVTDPMTGTFPVEMTVHNDGRDLLAGMVARTRIQMEEVNDGLVIPLYAVLPTDGGSSVFVESDGVAYKHDVVVALIVGDLASISEGIEEGDNIIVRGANYLEDGDDVRIVDEWESIEGEK